MAVKQHFNQLLAVTCHLHFWQNDRDLLRANALTRGWNGYRNKSQDRKSTPEKKILPPLLRGFEPATFQSRTPRSNHWAIPSSPTQPTCAPNLRNPSLSSLLLTDYREKSRSLPLDQLSSTTKPSRRRSLLTIRQSMRQALYVEMWKRGDCVPVMFLLCRLFKRSIRVKTCRHGLSALCRAVPRTFRRQ